MHDLPEPLPTVSVVIPTCRRPMLLERAIESVRSQTFCNWELLVSDDEPQPGESWLYLERLAASDPRIRPVRNESAPGQVGNTNNALVRARARWIKLLHDDDVLRPECLEQLLRAVEGLERVAIVACMATYVRNGRVRKRDRLRKPPRELIRSREVPLSMYLQEVGAGEPTRVMVHRRVIESGTLFEEIEGLTSGVDSDWNARASKHGDLLLINEHLVELHDEGHHRVTATLTAQSMDKEAEIIRRRQLALIDPSLNPPPLEVAMGMTRLISAMHRLKRRKVGAAFVLAREVSRLESWTLALRWALRQVIPGAASRVPRLPLGKIDRAKSPTIGTSST